MAYGNLWLNQMAQQGNFSWQYGRMPGQYNAQGVSPQPNAPIQGQGLPYSGPTGYSMQGQMSPMQGQGLPYNQPSIPTSVEGWTPQKKTPSLGANDYMAIAGAIPTLAADVVEAFKAPKYDTTVQGGDWSGTNLTHGLGDELARAHGIDTKGWIKQGVASNAMKFAGTGGSIGSMFGPLGTALGTAGGAIVGALTGFFGARRKKKKAEEQKSAILAEIGRKAGQFSEANIKAKQEQQAKRIALQNLT